MREDVLFLFLVRRGCRFVSSVIGQLGLAHIPGAVYTGDDSTSPLVVVLGPSKTNVRIMIFGPKFGKKISLF